MLRRLMLVVQKMQDPAFWGFVSLVYGWDEGIDQKGDPMRGLYEKLLPWLVDKPLEVIVRESLKHQEAEM